MGAESGGHEISLTRVYESEVLHKTADDLGFLIVMGDPQSPDEVLEQFLYYHPDKELVLLRSAIAQDKYIVGVCLGAQLLSVAYGAQYAHSPERENPMELTAEGQADPHVQTFGKRPCQNARLSPSDCSFFPQTLRFSGTFGV